MFFAKTIYINYFYCYYYPMIWLNLNKGYDMLARMNHHHTITLPSLNILVTLKKYWKAYLKAANNFGEVQANALYPRK